MRRQFRAQDLFARSNFRSYGRRFIGNELRRGRCGFFRFCGASAVMFGRRFAGVEFRWLRFCRISREFLSSEGLALQDIEMPTLRGGALDPVVVRSGTVFNIPVGCAMIVFFLRNQRLPIGDGDLVIVRMDFRKTPESRGDCPPQSTKAACSDGSTRVTLAR